MTDVLSKSERILKCGGFLCRIGKRLSDQKWNVKYLPIEVVSAGYKIGVLGPDLKVQTILNNDSNEFLIDILFKGFNYRLQWSFDKIADKINPQKLDHKIRPLTIHF